MATGLHHSGRVALRMEGAAVRDVLQSVVTNDVTRLGPDQAVYAALLTPQGKYLFDFFLVEDGESVLVDIAADRAQAFAQRMKAYCLRRDARVTGETGLAVGVAWAGDAGEPAPDGDGRRVLRDPRHPDLGWRIYADTPAAAADGLTPGTLQAYTALRVRLGIPETGIELMPENTYILEAGFDALAGVDFRKGCYVGQEVTARMHHKTELRKRLVRVRIEGSAEPGTPITAEGKPVGILFSQAGDHALAHLRLDRTAAAETLLAGEARVIYDG